MAVKYFQVIESSRDQIVLEPIAVKGKRLKLIHKYQLGIKIAALKLVDIEFGRAEGNPIADIPPKYDTTFWDTGSFTSAGRDGRQVIYPMLVLKKSKLPSDAVTEIIENPCKWRFDCAQFTEVCRWYGILTAIGENAFDKLTMQKLELKVFDSTLLSTKKMYVRQSLNSCFKSDSENHFIEGDTSEFIQDTPVGTRIAYNHWPNIQENTVKISNSEYLLNFNGLKKKIFSPDELNDLFGENNFPFLIMIPEDFIENYESMESK